MIGFLLLALINGIIHFHHASLLIVITVSGATSGSTGSASRRGRWRAAASHDTTCSHRAATEMCAEISMAYMVSRIEVLSPVTKPTQNGKTECCNVVATDGMDIAQIKLRDGEFCRLSTGFWSRGSLHSTSTKGNVLPFSVSKGCNLCPIKAQQRAIGRERCCIKQVGDIMVTGNPKKSQIAMKE
ncbi:hypothetical protein Tco_0748199 [Tanacetum coccineum]|uniref:Uncharacterized protein n=1 Tax=Tanacetum coccineum TaxID=301880 RepID=A0ABQ4YV43_9ASTR